MATPNEEDIQVYKEINIASYVTTIPCLILWILVLARIMREKEQAKFYILTIICGLMITNLIASMLYFQM